MPTRRHALRHLLGSAAALALPACGLAGVVELLIGTDLDRIFCENIEKKFKTAYLNGVVPRIGWVRVSPDRGESLARLVASGRPLDLIAGGAPTLFDHLAREGYLAPPPARAVADDTATLPWRTLRTVPVGLAIRSDLLQERALRLDPTTTATDPALFAALAAPVMAGLVAIDDPRRDADTLALAADRLAQGPTWAEGYADLVHLAARSAPVGVRSGAAFARLVRRELAVAPARGPLPDTANIDFRPVQNAPVEGIAVLARAPHADLAQRFLAAVVLDDSNRPVPPSDPAVSDLLATMLGATLVDAQPELVAAREALDRLEDPERAAALDAFLVEPPPWPPASIQRLAARGRRDLIDALAAQIAPDLERRYWLLQSWEAAVSPIDGDLLTELAGAVEGTLLAEPRLRHWLEAEWRAWARQRGRRVARQARQIATTPPTTTPTTPEPEGPPV